MKQLHERVRRCRVEATGEELLGKYVERQRIPVD